MTNLKRACLAAAATVGAVSAFGASHNDAPMINMDPSANITDVYAFVGKNHIGQKVLNIVMTVNPLEDPGNGVNYYRFDDNVMYSIHLEKAKIKDGQPFFTGKGDIRYNFRFKTGYKNLNTILSYGLGTEAGSIMTPGDARQNFVQTYTIQRVDANGSRMLNLGNMMISPPVNVGPRTTPRYFDAQGNVIRGANTAAELDPYTVATVYKLRDGSRSFCGQREDGFYADVPGIFDFLGVRSPGKDGFSSYNVHAISIEIPIYQIVQGQETPVVGVFATTSRPSMNVRAGTNTDDWVQVGRMGNPLFNETLVALKDKDIYNQTLPETDAVTFKKYAENCELAFLLNAVFGTNFVVNGRSDLVGIFIPDVLKVDLSTPPVRLAGEDGFNRLSFIGGDTVASAFTGGQVPSGWPNGRRFGDDVVDIALTAVASGPTFETINLLGDNVSANDAVYNRVFPHAGTPHGGPTNSLHQ